MNISIRKLSQHQEYLDCVELQRETWGQQTTEIAAPFVMIVANKIGGLVAGAFDAENTMVGFVIGLPGFYRGNRMNWSKMLAVKKNLRGQGLGRKLKLYQREQLLQQGIEHVYWTYDPLVARNAHLNLNKLGANIVEYVEKIYPNENTSDLHGGMDLDRFIVEWSLSTERVKQAITGRPEYQDCFPDVAIVNTSVDQAGGPIPDNTKLPALKQVRIEIPIDLEVIQQNSFEQAAKWRENTRRAFTWYLDRGYEVRHFYRDGERCFYVMQRGESGR